MFNTARQQPTPAQDEPRELRAATEEHAATTVGSLRLDDALAEADGRSAPARADLRASLAELRQRLAAEEAALAEAEASARQEVQVAFREWYDARGEATPHALDRASAFAIGRELREVTENRDVVLATTHPSLHREIAGAFDTRIDLLTARAEELDATLPEEGDASPPVLAGVAWTRQEPPALEAVVLRFEGTPLVEALTGAFRDLALELNGDGDVEALDEEGEPLRLMAGVSADAARGARDVAGRLSALISARLDGTEHWPTGARALVQPLDRDRVASLDAALWPQNSTA